MRILIIDNSSIIVKDGRHYTNALNGLFIDELIALGNCLTYFQFNSTNSNNISSFDLEEHGVECISLTPRKNKFLTYLTSYIKVIKVIKASDFVYLYYPNSFKYVAVLCTMIRKRYGLYIRGMNGVNNSFSKNIYKRAYTIFTVSDYFTNMVNSLTHKEIAHTIRPMIPYNDADIVPQRKYCSNGEYVILFLGRVAKDKGLVELIYATKRLSNMGCHFKLKIVGSGELYSELSDMIKTLDLDNVVNLEGPVYNNDKKADYYKQADIYILPTYHEGFPRTLYEAMIFGTPIITTFVGGIPALMKDKVNCLQIKPKSVESIVEGLYFAFNNYIQMCQFAMNAKETVRPIIDSKRPTHAQHLNQILTKM